jgi:hypothetical protein
MQRISHKSDVGRLSIYHIMKGKKKVGEVQTYYTSSFNTCQVDFYNNDQELIFSEKKTSGNGCNWSPKVCSVLHGFNFQGVQFYDNCVPCEKWKGAQKRPPKGTSLTNWDSNKQAYTSCYYISGLKRLESFGFKVLSIW